MAILTHSIKFKEVVFWLDSNGFLYTNETTGEQASLVEPSNLPPAPNTDFYLLVTWAINPAPGDLFSVGYDGTGSLVYESGDPVPKFNVKVKNCFTVLLIDSETGNMLIDSENGLPLRES